MHDLNESEYYAEAFRALSSPERLDILSHLKEEEDTTLDELSDYMENKGYDKASVSLVHVHLPLLEEYGVIESEQDTIKYRGDEVIEEVLETLDEDVNLTLEEWSSN